MTVVMLLGWAGVATSAAQAKADPSPPSAVLDHSCVPPAGMQGLTVHSQPGDRITYSTEYADQSNELTNPTYEEGFGAGSTDGAGEFQATWMVPANAPSGVAHVYYIAQGQLRGPLDFTVALDVGCPPECVGVGVHTVLLVTAEACPPLPLS
ncbi:MAG TPA: hypothetical protein VFA63_12585 [Pseudonocardiaceae bacterium]|nr:hypothetical protein [Pseudonocardiaceae bacterium]